jgi:hypothetical protein
MRIEGKRIHIAGSASSKTPLEQLQYAHSLVASLVKALARRGARFVVGVGKEPLSDDADLSSPSLIFDWTVLVTLDAFMRESGTNLYQVYGRPITSLVTNKTEKQVPEWRIDLWRELRSRDAIYLEFIDPGWTSGAVRRIRQMQLGDVLIALSGGEGVEHLAQLYANVGKPVIPLDLDMGSSMGDGSGGASRLAGRALWNPSRFVDLKDAGLGGSLFAELSTHSGKRPVEEVVNAILRLLGAIADPKAFCVRVLNSDVKEYAAVECFFRNVVDPVVSEFAYEPVEMGRGSATHAWMNEAIFDGLQYSQLVIVDLTGSRPSCFIELGYALGRANRVLITAMKGTTIPFDTKMLEYYAWQDTTADEARQQAFRDYWQRNIDRPPLVRPREVL